MKDKTKKLLIDAVAITLLCATLALTAILSDYLMRMGIAIESEMPAMQDEVGS